MLLRRRAQPAKARGEGIELNITYFAHMHEVLDGRAHPAFFNFDLLKKTAPQPLGRLATTSARGLAFAKGGDGQNRRSNKSPWNRTRRYRPPADPQRGIEGSAAGPVSLPQITRTTRALPRRIQSPIEGRLWTFDRRVCALHREQGVRSGVGFASNGFGQAAERSWSSNRRV
jgi:hypothetical protein